MTGMSGGQGPPDGSDSEEAEKCPVCLGVLTGGELAMPDSCCHVFCLPCLLTWAEFQMSPSCPVDRRPFSNIYRWDGSLGLVQVPVQKRLTPTEAESCCCRNPERNVCLKSKLARRLRREKTERTADTKTRGLVRKCNDDDPSSLSRKKVRAIECCTWSPTPTIVTPTQDVSDPVWLTEDGPFDPELKHCKTQAQSCPWLSSAVPIPADGASRQRFYGSGWNNNSFPFGSISSPFASNSPFRPSHFVFQGVVCAVTCPKGGEKRGSRSSTPKAPNKQPESLPCRRSVRNSRSQEETTSANPKSPTKSSLSDSDSSAGQSTKLAKTSQVPTKRKGKRVANRKASGKRKATRKKSCSPAASEEEDEGDGADNNEMIEDPPREQEVNNSEQQNDAEGVLNEEQSVFTSAEQPVEAESLKSEEEGDESQDQYGEQQQKEKADGSCSSVSACDSPLSCSEDKREEEWPASPVKTEEKESEERTSHSSPDSHNILLENSVSPQSDEYTKQDDNIEICVPSQEANNEESSIDSKDELCNNLTFSGSPKSEMSEENLANQEERTFIETDVEMPESTECLRDESSKGAKDTTPKEDVTTPKEDVTTPKEDLAMPKKDTVPKDGTPPRDDSMSKDDTNVVPMDCGSPISEHGNNLLFEPSDNKTYAASAIPPTPQTEVAKDDSTKRPQERERSQERKNGKPRRSRFHSPTSTWSPKRDSKKEPSRRSRSKERDGSVPVSRPSRARSRDRDRDGERDYSRRDRSHERRRRRPRSRSRSRSRSKSRSRSRSRTRSYRRMPSPERGLSRELSPQRKERRGGWKSGPGSGSGQDGRRYGGAGRFENGLLSENSLDRQGWSENPDWVTERTRVETEGRNRDLGSSGGSRWEDQRRSGGNGGEPRDRGGFERGRGAGGNCSFYNQQDEMADSRWQPRNNFSGTGNNSGNDSYSRFNENRGGGRKKESESGDSMLDRSGWSSASSWAVRRTLPADVQDYYSKRERGGVSSWNRQEEETQQPAATDPPKSDPPPPQVVPGNAPVAVMSVLPPHPPQLSVLHHQYPIQTLPVTLQPAAPYAMPPQVPVHLHPAVPLLQVPAVGTQGLPPPPPPPPPMQAGNQTSVTAAQPDGHTTQMMSTVVGFIKPTLLPTPTKASVAVVTQGQPAASQALPSSTTQHSKAQADGSKKEKKQQIQEKAINEVKTAIKPFYQKKEITKEEYKEIVRKAVEKVCHSKSGEVNSSKVANLVKAYVDKYKHARKK